VLRNHTDMQVAINGLDRSRYSLKLAQVIPAFPDIEVRADVLKETALAPHNTINTLSVSFPLPIWDRNKGNIIAAQGSLGRALEEPHRVETTLTTNLATAYAAYKTNLDALEDYRRHILPDMVRYYRGVAGRYNSDPNASFGDVVTAQQAYVTNVTSYLGVLGPFWTSVVNVAGLLQTDDLFQMSQVEELPTLPDLPCWPCSHGRATTCPPAPAPQAAEAIKVPVRVGRPVIETANREPHS
jgi:cobalt-zinc-cadmium efflux system outer membrane protein